MAAMKCPQCETAMVATVEDHRYQEFAANVVLQGVEVERCPRCQEWAVTIARPEELHRALAGAQRQTLLGGFDLLARFSAGEWIVTTAPRG